MVAGLADDRIEQTEPFSLTVESTQSRAWTKVFWIFLAFHFTVWTIVPTVTAPNQTLDALEMVGWGTQWQWGYYKHPPLPAWIAQAVTLIFGNSNLPLYATAALASSICLWSVFVLGRRIVGEFSAVVAAFALEASHYFSYSSVEFNNNVVSRAMAALAMVFVYKALRTQKWNAWFLSGVFIGLGLLAKYDVAIFALSLLVYALIDTNARRHWATAGPYIMLFAALVVSGPHWVWALANDFPTLRYAAERSAGVPSLWSHVTHPVYFCLSQMIAVLPIFAFVVIASRGSLKRLSNDDFRLGTLHRRYLATTPDARFVVSMVLGGFAMVVFMSLITGAAVRSMWGSCLWTFSGLAIVILFRQAKVNSDASGPSVRRVACMAVTVCLLMATVLGIRQSFGPTLSGKASRVHFPGHSLAQRIESAWDSVSDAPLPVIIGDHWLCNNAIFYGKDQPTPYINGSADVSPWVSDDVVHASGGIVLWQGAEPHELLSRFRVVKVADREKIEYSGHPNLPPVEISYAIVMPATTIATGQGRVLERMKR